MDATPVTVRALACAGWMLLLAWGAGGAETAAAVDPAGAFDWTVGTWRGVRVDGADGSGAPMEMRVEPILGGAGQARHLRVGQGSDAYLGYAVQIYDPEAGRWLRQYVNAVRRRFATLEGDVVSETSSLWRPATPRPDRLSRLDSERLPDERWRRTMHVSTDGGETWRVLWRDELSRAAP
jgi:hypothetical protein